MGRRKKSYLKRTFGEKFNIWDIVLLLLLIGYPAYIAYNQGIIALFKDLGGYIYAAIIVTYFGSALMRRAKK